MFCINLSKSEKTLDCRENKSITIA